VPVASRDATGIFLGFGLLVDLTVWTRSTNGTAAGGCPPGRGFGRGFGCRRGGFEVGHGGGVGESRHSRRGPNSWADDSRFNVVTGNSLDGTHMRHAILLQYYTHNNLVADNVITGGTARQHGASGCGNWIHRIRLTDNRHGIMIMLGTLDAVVEYNLITGGDSRALPRIELRNAPGTTVRSNRISGDQRAEFRGIRLITDPGDNDGNGASDPHHVLIKSNSVTGNADGVWIDAGQEIVLQRNRIAGNRINLQVDPGAGVVFR
jgi:hypothetical protein